ncbi:hypothetical protein PS624_03753 [Pseudomonas fluorescens]|uniref:Uncharacterized protein n=1 Tax=Pseudomonas fluorescens TaxID=294 RepID=A0A5E6UVF3_PSEFL|nr:hypothetical protein PS624_03753 [Pseudomonas fluorescens]
MDVPMQNDQKWCGREGQGPHAGSAAGAGRVSRSEGVIGEWRRVG